jgi:Tfp pilus assembly protein PilN
MDAVNLLPVEYRARKRGKLAAADEVDGRRTLTLGAAVALVLAVLLAGLYLHERSIVHSKQKHLAETQARLVAIQAQVTAVQAAQTAIAGRLTAAKSITASRMDWNRALDDFARVIPTSSYLTALQVAAPSAGTTDTSSTTTSTGSSALTISGVSPGTTGVAQVMDKLALLPWLSNVSLTTAARQTDGSDTFTITAGVSQR